MTGALTLLVFTLICLGVALVVSHFGFEGRTLVLIASVPGHCVTWTFLVLSVYIDYV